MSNLCKNKRVINELSVCQTKVEEPSEFKPLHKKDNISKFIIRKNSSENKFLTQNEFSNKNYNNKSSY